MHCRDIIDVDAYPIDAPNSAKTQQLIAECHRSLESRALCQLPGFVRPAALRVMTAELQSTIPRAHYMQRERTAYPGDTQTWPAGHPRALGHRCSYAQVLTQDIATHTLLRRLYQWPVLTKFIGLALGEPVLHRSACPSLSLTIKAAHTGDTDGWHYDPNDFVVSLMLQAPEHGGEFEYAPYSRSASDENYNGVSRIFADAQTHAQRPALQPGTFVLFKGNLSLHRVRPVGTTRQPRLMALLSYDRKPDQRFGERYIDSLRNYPRLADLDNSSGTRDEQSPTLSVHG